MADMTSKTNRTGRYIKRKRKRSPLLLTLGTFIVLVAGILTLLWQAGQQENSRADAGDVVGPPTLTATAVNQIFARVGSPMVGTGAVVEQASRSTNIDDAFALAVWWTETNDGAAGVGSADLNPGSVRGASGYPAAFDGYTIYPSYAVAINDWFSLLRSRYVNQGLTSAYSISPSYVGTTGAAAWANKVVNLMLRYHGQPSTSALPAASILVPAAPAVIPAAPPPARARLVEHKSVPPTNTGANNSQKHDTAREPTTTRKPHRPVLVGLGQRGAQASGQTTPKSVPIAAQHNAAEIFTTHVQQVLIILALLASLLVILPGIRLKWGHRKHAPLLADERITGGLEAMGFLPLYLNEYSPRVPGVPGEQGIQDAQSESRETGALAWDEARQVTQVTQMIPLTPLFDSIGTVPLTPFIASRRSGETALRRARLVPAGSTRVREDTQAIHSLQARERATEGIGTVPRRPGETGYAGQKEQVIRKSQVKNS